MTDRRSFVKGRTFSEPDIMELAPCPALKPAWSRPTWVRQTSWRFRLSGLISHLSECGFRMRQPGSA